MSKDILIRNAALPRTDDLVSIHLTDGEITAVGDTPSTAGTVIDADGGLVTPPFVDAHTHLDKAMVAQRLEADTGTLDEAVAAMRAQKDKATREDVRRRAEEAIGLHLEHGCNRIRTHVDVDQVGGLTGLDGVQDARETYSDRAEVQIVAFPQEGLLTEDGSVELMEEAMDRGADIVGGIPAFETSTEDEHRHIDILLELADDHGVPVDMHIDENGDPGSRTLEYLATRARELGLDDGRVTASHACALSSYPDEYAAEVIGLVAEADINVITNPGTNLLLQGRDDAYPRPRGLTRVDQLRDAGVTMAAGQDNMQDGFYPYGEGNMLEVGSLLSHAAHMDSQQEQAAVLDMVTTGAAAVIGVDATGITTGAPADLNILPPSTGSITAALRGTPRPRYRIRDGLVLGE